MALLWPCYGLAIAAAIAVFMDRAAKEQRSTFYTVDAAELCISYVTNHLKHIYMVHTYEYVHIYEFARVRS